MKKAAKEDKLTFHDIPDPMFGLPIILIEGPRELYAPFIIKKCRLPEDHDVPENGHVISNGDATILWIHDARNPKQLPTIIHELFHIAWNIAPYRQVPLEKNNDEVFAYYAKMMGTKILKALGHL